jgi:hypothetical protein
MAPSLSRLTFGLLVLGGLAASATAHPQPEGPPGRIERLVGDLDHERFPVREAATAELKRLGPAAAPALRRLLAGPVSAEARRRAEAILRLVTTEFEGRGSGWHWIYGGIAHGQTFQATGRHLQSLRLRVARLNATRSAAPLEVEIRDLTLRRVYARGVIPAEQAERAFAWREVQLGPRAPLAREQTYVLFFHSQDSTSRAPWVVNAIYQDLYPHGTHLGYTTEDFFFRLTFTDGWPIHVGPPTRAEPVVPISSGSTGGGPAPGPLALVGFGPVPPAEDAPGGGR